MGDGTPGYSVTGTLASESMISNPTDICIDSNGNLYIVVPYFNIIQKISNSSGE